MFRLLFLIFIAVPLIEIYLLIQIGGLIGALPTVALVVLTAALGAVLLKFQGIATVRRAQRAVAHGQLPAVPVLEGVILLICGALLLTPGFFTDVLGFLGLIPPLRRKAVMLLIERGIVQTFRHRHPGQRSDRRPPDVIEGDFRREEDDERR